MTVPPDPSVANEETASVVEPPAAPGVGHGLKGVLTENLFKDAKNSALTVVFGALILFIASKAVSFVFFNTKTFTGDDGELVTRSGWEVVQDQLINYMLGPNYGRIGNDHFKVWIGVWLIALALGLVIGSQYNPDAKPMARRTKLAMLGAPALGIITILAFTRTIMPTLATLAAVAFLEGGRRGMRTVPPLLRGRVAMLALLLYLMAVGLWSDFSIDNLGSFGGLLLTFTVASISIVACFPIGVVMALARRSSFPLIRPFAVGYIELIRGVPLISLLFLGQFALGLLLPADVEEPEAVIRAIIMITLFSAAYVAEIVRGGLQSVAGGQVEAGQAVGLQPLTITRRIVLPQALRNSIPPLIGQFISLLKDTTLLFIIAQRELLGVTAPILQLPQFRFQGFTQEAYAFVAFLFWIICFTMSRASQRLETRLGVSNR